MNKGGKMIEKMKKEILEEYTNVVYFCEYDNEYRLLSETLDKVLDKYNIEDYEKLQQKLDGIKEYMERTLVSRTFPKNDYVNDEIYQLCRMLLMILEAK